MKDPKHKGYPFAAAKAKSAAAVPTTTQDAVNLVDADSDGEWEKMNGAGKKQKDGKEARSSRRRRIRSELRLELIAKAATEDAEAATRRHYEHNDLQ